MQDIQNSFNENMKTTIELELDRHVATVTTQTLDLLYSDSKYQDALVLYFFYIKTAKWQKNASVKANGKYCMKCLHWGDVRFKRTKALLKKLNLIEDIVRKDDSSGKFEKHYIKVKFVWKEQKSTLSETDTMDEKTSGTVVAPVDEKTSGAIHQPVDDRKQIPDVTNKYLNETNINNNIINKKNSKKEKKEEYGNLDINRAMTVLQEHSPYATKPKLNRYVAYRQLKKSQLEEFVATFIKVRESQDEKFCPVITDFVDLEQKRDKVENFFRKRAQEGGSDDVRAIEPPPEHWERVNRLQFLRQLEKNKQVDDLLKLFKPINPFYEKFFEDEAERKAMEEVMDEFTYEMTKISLSELPAILEEPYAPRITSPIALQKKMEDLRIFVNQVRKKRMSGGGLTIVSPDPSWK